MTDNLMGGIFPQKPKHVFSPRPQRQFFAWHKPRKQYLRKYQWMAASENLISELHSELKRMGRPLHYLSMPGPDMLDVRLLAQLCQKYGLNMRLLGFDTNGTESEISWHEISRHIVPTSVLAKEDIGSLADIDGVAFQNVNNIGPFDIINLDLCDSAASPMKSEAYHRAFLNLLQYQINRRTDPWLFFLTTRINSTAVSGDIMGRYIGNVVDNCNQHVNFRTVLNSKGVSDCRGVINTHLKPAYFSVCFAKWLLKLMTTILNRWKLQMQESYKYKVNPGSLMPDMLSLAFLIQPITIALSDPSGIVESELPIETVIGTEEELAIEIVHKSFAIQDLDYLLNGDAEKYAEMIEESAQLMKEARYDADQYRAWVENGCQT